MAVGKGAGEGIAAFTILQHPPLPKPPATTAVPPTLLVGGSNIGTSALDAPVAKKQKRRGPDRRKRKPRKCRRCGREDCHGRAANMGPSIRHTYIIPLKYIHNTLK